MTVRLAGVASRADAWIETVYLVQYTEDDRVASRADAWIETLVHINSNQESGRVPRGRVD